MQNTLRGVNSYVRVVAVQCYTVKVTCLYGYTVSCKLSQHIEPITFQYNKTY